MSVGHYPLELKRHVKIYGTGLEGRGFEKGGICWTGGMVSKLDYAAICIQHQMQCSI
jgi:hypothetical protein